METYDESPEQLEIGHDLRAECAGRTMRLIMMSNLKVLMQLILRLHTQNR